KADPRVVAQDVQFAPFLADPVHQPPDFFRPRHVRGNKGGRAPRLPDLLFALGPRFLILFRDVDVGPFPAEAFRRRAADALPSAGDDRRLIRKKAFFQSLSPPDFFQAKDLKAPGEKKKEGCARVPRRGEPCTPSGTSTGLLNHFNAGYALFLDCG